MNTMTETNHHPAHQGVESAFARRSRLAAVGAIGGMIGSMAGGAVYYAGPLGVVLSMVAGAALLLTIGASRH
jgi:hypothetical protein